MLLVFVAMSIIVSCSYPGTSGTTTATPVVLATLQPLPDDVLAIYHKTGGIAGVDETLIVHHGGLLEWRSRSANKSLKVDEPTVQQLRTMLEDKNFSQLESRYQAAGADLFTYTITARDGNGNVKTVTAMDTAKYPDYLGVLIGMLDNLRAIVAKNG